MYYASVLLLKKQVRELKPEELFFIQNCGLQYLGQFTNPLSFYSQALKNNVKIILFDPRDFENLDEVVDVLNSLQSFANCYIILCRDMEDEYKKNLKIVDSNPTIKEPILKISDSLLQIKRIEKTMPSDEDKKLFINIQNILYNLGFSSAKKGFIFICDAIFYVYSKRTPNVDLIGDVYKYVAEKNETNYVRVERNIRTAITDAMLNCDHRKLAENNKYRFFDRLMEDVTAKQFILSVVNFLKYNTLFMD